MADNLYVHFPFCRRKCAYCALHSRAGVSPAARDAYVVRLARQTAALGAFDTVYFGGGSPALCDLVPLLDALGPHLVPNCEFTVELHPLDVTDGLLATLKAGGVNRVSMGVQSLDDATLAAMGRGYVADEAARAFARVRRVFDNAGVDFIVGYPNDPCVGWSQLADWGLRHCSVYSLQVEERTLLARHVARGQAPLRSDDWTMDRLRTVAATLRDLGLVRYEISNYAQPGFSCRHNRAVWRGEDYVGLGEGASGRLGRTRTFVPPGAEEPEVTTLTPTEDLRERTLFRLRTDEGLDLSRLDEWSSDPAGARRALQHDEAAGLLSVDGQTCCLTARGAEVCDAVLAAVL